MLRAAWTSQPSSRHLLLRHCPWQCTFTIAVYRKQLPRPDGDIVVSNPRFDSQGSSDKPLRSKSHHYNTERTLSTSGCSWKSRVAVLRSSPLPHRKSTSHLAGVGAARHSSRNLTHLFKQLTRLGCLRLLRKREFSYRTTTVSHYYTQRKFGRVASRGNPYRRIKKLPTKAKDTQSLLCFCSYHLPVC